MKDVMATTGYNFEGYRIVEYYGIVFANVKYISRNKKYNDIDDEDRDRIVLEGMEKLKRQVVEMRGNAMIGYSGSVQGSDYFTNAYYCTATAVRVEKI